ncbi:hypothetical protein ACWDBO_42400 [Streptomyces mirabilis]|uniref:hypothetical protein n=1 Tax=Streptomyces mirabilis TaxID=68239 RepID=UPI003D9F56BF
MSVATTFPSGFRIGAEDADAFATVRHRPPPTWTRRSALSSPDRSQWCRKDGSFSRESPCWR